MTSAELFVLREVARRVGVSRQASAPVLLMTNPASFARVVVVSDNTPASTRAADLIAAIPPESLEHVTFLMVNPAGEIGEAIGVAFQDAASALEDAGVGVEIVDATGNEVDIALEQAERDNATLIVAAATDDQVGEERVLGTTAHGLIDRAPCSLLVAR